MLHRILAASLAAGILAGLATAAVQAFTTTPLIIAAEAYEKSGDAKAAQRSNLNGSGNGQGHLILAQGEEAGVSGAGAEWGPQDRLERTFYTSVSSIALAFGFALMLISAMIVAGAPITARSGLAWGAAAFVATGLAPALGLSPELPGSAAAELVARQTWWIATVVATAAGLFLALRVSSPWAIGLGLVLICAPHLAGAPYPLEFTSAVPAELSSHFASASLVLHAVMWSLVGAIAGYVWQRGEPDAAG